ncbi:hypothetical protein Droror1_Dr00017888 [Drosera rotundifolia]
MSWAKKVEKESNRRTSYVDMLRKDKKEEMEKGIEVNRDTRKGLSLSFENCAQEEVTITMKDVIEKRRYWSCALFGYVLGSRMPYAAMEEFVQNQ